MTPPTPGTQIERLLVLVVFTSIFGLMINVGLMLWTWKRVHPWLRRPVSGILLILGFWNGIRFSLAAIYVLIQLVLSLFGVHIG